MPAVMPGTMRNGTPALASACASSPPRPEHEGIAALQTQHAMAFARQLHQQIGNLILLAAFHPGALAGIDQFRAGPRQFQQPLIDQRIVKDEIGPRQRLQSQRGYEPRIARPAANQPNPALFQRGKIQRFDGGVVHQGLASPSTSAA